MRSGESGGDDPAPVPVGRLLLGPGGTVRDWWRALRPRHWIKNALALVPLAAAHETSAALWLAAAGVFAALSACASGAYLCNDALDLPHDRRHPTRRHRPLAAGKIPLRPAVGAGAALMAIGLALAFRLSAATGLCVLLYVITALTYSLWLKRRMFIDVIALAMLFALRVLAGGVAVSVPLSPWLLAFSGFIFLALAIVKRQRELHALRGALAAVSLPGGRAYRIEDLATLAALGAASSLVSVLVLALYIDSPEVSERYARPEFLWTVCLLLLYWLGRVALLANRGEIDDDPVVFATRDPASLLTGLGVLAAFAAAL